MSKILNDLLLSLKIIKNLQKIGPFLYLFKISKETQKFLKEVLAKVQSRFIFRKS
jgi:hypothetical protein